VWPGLGSLRWVPQLGKFSVTGVLVTWTRCVPSGFMVNKPGCRRSTPGTSKQDPAKYAYADWLSPHIHQLAAGEGPISVALPPSRCSNAAL
jgi:hypothetical protein